MSLWYDLYFYWTDVSARDKQTVVFVLFFFSFGWCIFGGMMNEVGVYFVFGKWMGAEGYAVSGWLGNCCLVLVREEWQKRVKWDNFRGEFLNFNICTRGYFNNNNNNNDNMHFSFVLSSDIFPCHTQYSIHDTIRARHF